MLKYGIPHQRGFIASTPEDAKKQAIRVQSEFKSKNFIVKSQILAGGRGKGVFNTGYKGGVKFTKSVDEVEEVSKQMLGHKLTTIQTPPEGIEVKQVYVAECLDFDKEFYFAIVFDRGFQAPVMIASKEGGVEIEEVAKHNPDAIAKEPIDTKIGPTKKQLKRLGESLGLTGKSLESAQDLMAKFYKLMIEKDATQIEINPLVVTPSGDVVCIDAKINFDDNASFRQEEVFKLRDYAEEDPREVTASKFGLNYIGLDGNIGCLVNGAGLAMATMDIIKLYGGKPANFLDVGGGATTEQVREALKILTDDPRVECVLVNIFGGIMRCDIIANGILEAVKQLGNVRVPIVARLSGTNSEQGKKILLDSGMKFIAADDLDSAAQKAVATLKK
jgi:succinyl-CoA synthetase beta subunit